MTSNHIFVLICFSVSLFISGLLKRWRRCCSRSQCTANRSPQRCSRLLDEGSRRRSQLQASVPGSRERIERTWGGPISKLAKTHKLGKLWKKRSNLDKDDPLAPLYLGIVLLKTGERERGRKEIEEGLRAIDDTIEFFVQEDSF